jgi:hypothetical protein
MTLNQIVRECRWYAERRPGTKWDLVHGMGDEEVRTIIAPDTHLPPGNVFAAVCRLSDVLDERDPGVQELKAKQQRHLRRLREGR